MRNKMTSSVAEDQIENVGIMQGFMDDIDEMMKEIDTDMMPDPNDEDDVAMVLGRSPDSPEILMNNLRGDYRSIDARREELADLVGYNAAAETPDQVLALLQPLLAQQMAQGIGAIEPPVMPMGDMPMPMQQDPMAMQQDLMMGAPAPMATGGMVQRFQEGSTPAGVTRSGPSALDEFLARQGQASVDPMARTKELSPAYRELLGLGDAGADRSGMAFDIAQAALNFAGNVDPQGQPMRGSFASRLAGAASALPAQMGKRAEAARQDETRARLAALQQAQSEQASTLASNTALSSDQRAILLEQMKQENELANRARYRMATPEELAALGAPPESIVQVDQSTGKFDITRPSPATNINVGGGKLSDVLSTNAANQLDASYTQATAALGTLNTVNNVRPLLEEELFSGPLSSSAMFVSRLGQSLGVEGGDSQERLQNTVLAMQGLAEFELLAAQAMRGQGAITENERALIRRASAGDLGTMTQGEVKELMGALEKTAKYRIQSHENRLAQYANVLQDDPASSQLLRLYQLGNTPISPAAPAPTVLRFDEQGNPLQ